MNPSNESTPSQITTARLPAWFRILGAIVFIGSATLSGRIIYEQTVLTWEFGPQMIGFSLAHGPGVILFLFPILLVAWIVITVVLTGRSLLKGSRVSKSRWVSVGTAFLILGSQSMPDGFWQRAFIARMASSPNAGDLMLYAAYRGDLGTVRGMVSHGVKVDSTDHSDWRTALHGAASRGDLRTAQYLISKGANINALDRFGDSPLELAEENNNGQVAHALQDLGAKRIKGDETQRQKAVHDIVKEDTDRMNGAATPDSTKR